MATDLSAQIIDAASGPTTITVDGLTTSGPSPLDLIAVDKYLNGKAAATRKGRGLRFTLLRPPGAVTRNYGPLGTRGC